MQDDLSLAELGEISKTRRPIGRALRRARSPEERAALMNAFKDIDRGAPAHEQKKAVREARRPLVASGKVRPDTRADRVPISERVDTKIAEHVDRAVQPVTQSVNRAAEAAEKTSENVARAATESTANVARAAEKSTENVHRTVEETRGAVKDTSRNLRNIGIGLGAAGVGTGAAGLGYVGASRHFNSRQKKPPKQKTGTLQPTSQAAVRKFDEGPKKTKKEKPEYRGGYVASPFTETQVRRDSVQRRALRPLGGYLLGGGAGRLADIGAAAATKGRYKPKRGLNAKNVGRLAGASAGFSQNVRSRDVVARSRATGREADYKITVPFPVAGKMNVYGYKPERRVAAE